MWNAPGQAGTDGHRGGYMAGTQSFGQSPTPTQGQSDQNRRFVNIVPTSVRGIMRGLQPDDTMRIGTEKVGMVVVLGIITSVEVQSTVVTFKIDDTTGPPLVVKQWLDQHGRQQKDTSDVMKPLVENCYVKVTGSVRTTNGEAYLVSHNVASLTHLNELTTHLLEIAVVKTLLEQGIKSSITSGGITGTQQGTGFGNNSSFGPSRGGADSFQAITGLTPQQQTVFQAIRSYDDENGCSVAYLMSNIKGISQDMIRKTVSLLSDEGHIYSTIDDDHFKATDQ